MARMLGRYETPGCCPGTRSGWYHRRHVNGGDCSGADTSTRWRKRVEQREFARELLPEGELPTPFDDPTACVHGCNGECLVDGSDWCTFACHLDGVPTEAEWRRAWVELAAQIWPGGSLTRTRREQVQALLEHHRQVRAARES